MAQKGTKRKQAPAYSSDTMALRYIAGLALIALGVVIFMAVDLGMAGFAGLKTACFGLCGVLAYVLAALPLWAGFLVIWSTQRRAPVRPWVFALLSFIGICTFIMLTSGGELAMNQLDQKGGNYGGVIGRAFWVCENYNTGGGALGVILGWPLWKLFSVGPLWAGLILIATLFCLLMMVNLTPSKIKALVTGRASDRRNRQEDERAQADAQQMAWQQQQAMQQQMAWQQEQQRIIEQQQAMARPDMRPQMNQAPVQQPAYPANEYNRSAADVQAWQDQLTARQTAASPEQTQHQSRIFGRKDPVKAEKAPRSWVSRIFEKKPADDGLVDTASPAAVKEALQKAAEATKRRTATDKPIVQPATHWQSVSGPVPADEVSDAAGSRAKDRQQPVNRDAYKRPQPAAVKAEEPAPADSHEDIDTNEAADRPQFRRTRTEKEKPQPVKQVPVVQQTIGTETYKPDLKIPPKAERDREPEDDDWMPVPYNYPPITDLAMPKPSEENTAAEDELRSRKLEETLASFRVQARVVHVTHGPAISRFEMELAAGTKVNNVAKLEKDIAYGMEATSVRIEAPIPGKSLVGVEVPNRKVATVTLREVLQSEKMQNAKSLLTVALGKDIAGTPIVCDLAKMPHMLIAGQTGSGKSVCINAIINSLLYRASPDEVKLILVDPKVVELQCYNGIPHLLIPVVNDPHKAAAALAWAVAEMMERYDKFAERKVRNLDGYNSVIKPNERPMSRIVIIIDELADLMMVCKKDVEEYICRITQLARAAGIHLIVATQRPSVDVITGLIKANIPSRIAFKTASYVDSRTILDRNGSEQLLGWGDMLYLPTGSFAPTRIQGCFLSDDEVNRIADHVRQANPCVYDPNVLDKLEQLSKGQEDGPGMDIVGGDVADNGSGDADLFAQAVEFAIADGQISTSTLQRRLKVGYARAGRLTDEMEERGIVSAKDGSKPRKCLITREQWEEMKAAGAAS